jgi:hypothetical protein
MQTAALQNAHYGTSSLHSFLLFFQLISYSSSLRFLFMANPQDVIESAFAKLKQSVSEEDAHEFDTTELKDVWLAVRSIQSEQKKRQSAQNLRRIEPFLRGIEKYSKVIEVLCNGTPYMPYVWVRTLLASL